MSATPSTSPMHPGEVLAEEYLGPLDNTQHRLAIEIGVPPRRINEIVHGNGASAWTPPCVSLATSAPPSASGSIFKAITTSKPNATGLGAVLDEITDDEFRVARPGSATFRSRAMLGMSVGLREGFVSEDERGVLTTMPTTLAAWAGEHLAPALLRTVTNRSGR